MQNSSSSVRVARDTRQDDSYRSTPEDETANQKDRPIDESVDSRRTRRGALWGAGLGFLVGLVPLLMSTVMGAIAGVLVARASRIRVDRVSAPSIHFGSRQKDNARG